MNRGILLGYLFLSVTPAAATTVSLDVNFESPAYSVGAVNGQDGWDVAFITGASVSTAYSRSGTQSLATVAPGPGGAYKELDPGQILDPSNPGDFSIGFGSDWWVQGWVRVPAGGAGARFGLASPGWYVFISGTGTPSVETALPGQPPAELPNQGANVLDQWIFVRMAHTAAMGQDLQVTILGDNINVVFDRGYSAPGPFARELLLSGDAYWDDLGAGSGAAPQVVPAPAAGWLLATGLAGLIGSRRRAHRLR